MTIDRHHRQATPDGNPSDRAESDPQCQQIELAFVESQERMAMAVDAARMGTYDLDLVTKVATWNAYHSLLLDYPPSSGEYTYADWECRVHPADLSRITAAFRQAMETQTDYSEEYRVVWNDGSIHWIHRFGRFYYDDRGRAMRTAGVATDITDRKEADLKIAQSEERLSLAFDAAQMGSFDWNMQTDRIVWNGYHARLLGYPTGAGEYTYADWECTVHPDDLARVGEAIELARVDRTDYSSEYRIVWADGTVRWLAGFGRFHYDLDGCAQRMTGVILDITDRQEALRESKRTEQALRESERRYRALVEATAKITWSMNAQGACEAVQPGWATFTGQSYPEYCGNGWLAAIHPDDRLDTQRAWSAAVQNLTLYEIEHRVRRYDGEYRYMSVRGVPILRSTGAVQEWVGIHTDITEQQAVLHECKQTERRYRALIEATAQIVWTTDANGHIVTELPSWSAFTGQSFEEYRGWGWSAAFHPNDRARIDELWLTSLANLTTFEMEQRLRRADGQYRHMSVRGIPILNVDGSVQEWVGVHTDITDRIHAELALRESEARFRSTFEQSGVGFAHVGLSGRWLFVNHKLCEITGYSEAELLASNFQDITHPDDLPQDRENIRQILAGEIQIVKFEKRYLHKRGQIVWVNLTGTLRRDETGNPLYFIATFEQIDDRKQAEFALREQAVKLAKTTAQVELRNQELNRFSYVVSHDLKAPLRAIANLSEWIEDDLDGRIDPVTQKNLELMRSRVRRMENLIDGLLEYARAGNTPVSVVTFSVERLLAEIIDSLSIPDSFTIDLPTDLPPITTNRTLLSQVLANSIGNAYKHHHRDDGCIRVTAQPGDRLWEFTIADDGVGIAPEHQERIFEMFQTLADPDKKNTGIGLSIVKKIVQDRGGNISIASELGAGTTFRFTWVTETD